MRVWLLFMLLLLAGCAGKFEAMQEKEVKNDSGGEIMAKNILMVVAPADFRDEELNEPKKIFENAGFNVTIASKGVKVAKGMLGAMQKVDLDLSIAKAADYDAVVFVGGAGAQVYFNDSYATNLAKQAYDSGKVTAAICIAPSILANAGILEGKKATSFQSEQSNLEENGADYTGTDVAVDGKIVTANGPNAAKAFGEVVVRLMK